MSLIGHGKYATKYFNAAFRQLPNKTILKLFFERTGTKNRLMRNWQRKEAKLKQIRKDQNHGKSLVSPACNKSNYST